MKKFLLTTALVLLSVAQASSYLRVVHAAMDAPAVDVYVDDVLLESKMEYTTVSPFKTLSSVLHTLRVTPTGKKDVLIETTVEMADDFAYILDVHLSDGTLESNLGGFGLADREDGQVDLNFYHFSPTGNAVDLKPSKGAAIFEEMSYLDASSSNVTPFKGKLSLRVAGKSTVLSEMPDFAYEANKMYSIYVFSSKKGLILKQVEDIFP
jgi:hypothetical protein